MVALLALMAVLLPISASAQGTIVPFIPQAFYDSSGNPLSGGKLCTYVAGTTTPQSTYSDVTLVTANANPVILSASGRPTTGAIYLSPVSYKFTLMSAGSDSTCNTGTVQWTLDNIAAIPQTSGNVDVTGTAGEALVLGDVVYLSDGSGALTAGRFYKADADFAYASSTAGITGIATAAISSAATGSIRLGGRMTGLSSLSAGSTYYVSATAGALTATAPTNARAIGTSDTTTTLLLAPNPPPPTFTLVADGRLTATTATPVTTADVSAATSIYYTPYVGNRIALYSGTGWGLKTFPEITISLSGCTASKPYDVFLYDNAGTVASEILVWTNATTRATALVLQDGAYVKTGATTRRYVGSFYCNASGGQTDDTLAKRTIYNHYNRVLAPLRRIDSTATWAYNSATIRQANGSTANQIEVMVGVSEDAVQLGVAVYATGTVADFPQAGIGLDSTTAFVAGQVQPGVRLGSANGITCYASYVGFPGVGYHTLTWLEARSGAAAVTFDGSNGGADFGGLSGLWRR